MHVHADLIKLVHAHPFSVTPAVVPPAPPPPPPLMINASAACHPQESPCKCHVAICTCKPRQACTCMVSFSVGCLAVICLIFIRKLGQCFCGIVMGMGIYSGVLLLLQWP